MGKALVDLALDAGTIAQGGYTETTSIEIGSHVRNVTENAQRLRSQFSYLSRGIRADDEETTVRKRLDIYHQQTEPLVGYYKGEAAAGRTRYERLDGTQAVDVVSQQLANLLG